MIYQGNKARLRKYIVPFIQNCIDRNNIKTYIEPFVGGANVIDHIRCSERIGTDINRELITLLNYMKYYPDMAIFPEECPFKLYNNVREARKKHTGKYSPEFTAGIGYFASYGGRYFDGGYGRDKKGERSVYNERLRYARKQAPLLANISFRPQDYRKFLGTKGCVFYLDPPYKGTKEYNGAKFDSEAFADFARAIGKDNFVFISEFDMPDDFRCVWQKERAIRQKSDRTVSEYKTERLFTIGLSSEK